MTGETGPTGPAALGTRLPIDRLGWSSASSLKRDECKRSIMPVKGSGSATDWQEIDEWDEGTGWLAYPDEALQRASHLLTAGDDVWLVDPVDFDGLDEFIADHGRLRGTIVLIARHSRDADTIARRHDVPVYIADWMQGLPGELKADVEVVHKDIPDSEYGIYKLIDNRLWQEGILYGGDSKTLVVPEAVGTNAFYCLPEERIGVNPLLRLSPPWRLRQLPPERVLVGHGTGVFTDAETSLLDALDGARRRAPRAALNALRAYFL